MGGEPAAALYTADGQGGWGQDAVIESVAVSDATVEVAVPISLIVPERSA